MKFLLTLSAFLLSITAYCQLYKEAKYENVVHGLTTIIKVMNVDSKGNVYARGQATGFFFHQYGIEKQVSFEHPINCIDSTLKNIWLITNKHVLFGNNYKTTKLEYPGMIQFYLRRKVPSLDHPVWDTIQILKSALPALAKVHSDSTIDVVAINISKYVLPLLTKADSSYYYAGISNANFPIGWLVDNFNLNVGKEILAIGYPREFYDQYNLFPTVKSGIIASKWGHKYDNKPYFLIDCKLFPGSSGSIVISKHITFAGKEQFDFFVFLGIFSGELIRQRETVEFEEMTITRKESYDTGIIWYYYLIEEIINSVSLK